MNRLSSRLMKIAMELTSFEETLNEINKVSSDIALAFEKLLSITLKGIDFKFDIEYLNFKDAMGVEDEFGNMSERLSAVQYMIDAGVERVLRNGIWSDDFTAFRNYVGEMVEGSKRLLASYEYWTSTRMKYNLSANEKRLIASIKIDIKKLSSLEQTLRTNSEFLHVENDGIKK